MEKGRSENATDLLLKRRAFLNTMQLLYARSDDPKFWGWYSAENEGDNLITEWPTSRDLDEHKVNPWSVDNPWCIQSILSCVWVLLLLWVRDNKKKRVLHSLPIEIKIPQYCLVVSTTSFAKATGKAPRHGIGLGAYLISLPWGTDPGHSPGDPKRNHKTAMQT